MTKAEKLKRLNWGLLIASTLLWAVAVPLGWLESVTFVSHVSMAALVLTAISGLTAGDAAVEAEHGD